MNTEELFSQIKQLKLDYGIKQDKRANETDRKRIVTLITDILLELSLTELEELFDYKVVSIAKGIKSLSDIMKVCIMATDIESALFNRLKSETLKCDPLCNEKKLPLKIWMDNNTPLNIGIFEAVIRILKEDTHGSVQLEERTNRKRPARAVRIKQECVV